jgi:hypothetical protein
MTDRLEILEERLDLEELDDGPKTSNFTDLLYPTPAPRNTWGILKWWESRRWKYNVIVGASGFASLGAFTALMSIPPSPHDLTFTWAPIIGFGVLANICYLLGPTVETAIEKISRGKILPTGPGLFRMGLTFSVGLTLLPTLVASMDWAFRLVRWLF